MDRIFAPQPAPKSKLGNYRQLATTAGVHVSPIIFGGMSVGDKWGEYGLGEMDKETSYKLLDAYYDLGGNFIDTANFYQNGTSEEFIGEWMDVRGVRDQIFVATKFSGNAAQLNPNVKQKVLYGGTSAKSMHVSLEISLKRLRTSYIDLFYVHYWDYTTSIPELMHALHALVTAGKVIYLGISDTPAWIVSKANQYARDHALTPFSVYQGLWNVGERSFERDIIPMARSEGMALAPWNVLMGGKIRTDAQEEERRKTGENGRTWAGNWERTEKEREISLALEKVAKEVGAKHITSVAIAYLMHKTTHVFPIIGVRKVDQLISNIEALEISLTSEHIKAIEEVVPFDAGFPTNAFGDGSSYTMWHYTNGAVEMWPLAQPITGGNITFMGKPVAV